ncbi:MAG: hypothetical protein KDI09_15285 [Halioglobus sp.]|nr:hypothetical protein [Halioglobus sp.]
MLASCAWQSNANEGLPRDVARFIERRDSCEHFMGEEPYDVQRAAYLARQAEKYCRGSDAELSRLKAKFSSNGRVIAELEKYDSDIEP